MVDDQVRFSDGRTLSLRASVIATGYALWVFFHLVLGSAAHRSGDVAVALVAFVGFGAIGCFGLWYTFPAPRVRGHILLWSAIVGGLVGGAATCAFNLFLSLARDQLFVAETQSAGLVGFILGGVLGMAVAWRRGSVR